MKKLFVTLMFLMWALIGNAQFTELKEARVGFDPATPEVIINGNTYTFKINKNYGSEFEEDPIAFLENHCQMEAFVEMVQDRKCDGYFVDVKSTKGYLKAEYCKEGNLQKVSYRLKNILLPPQLQQEVYGKNKGWKMTRNVHYARGKRGVVTEEFFRIRLEKDGEVRHLKIDMDELRSVEVAGI